MAGQTILRWRCTVPASLAWAPRAAALIVLCTVEDSGGRERASELPAKAVPNHTPLASVASLRGRLDAFLTTVGHHRSARGSRVMIA
jgi:hypothetical protein